MAGTSPTPLRPDDDPRQTSLAEQNKGERLQSWKEIAAYLGRDPRTVQRWEKLEALPVRRLQHASGGSVYAFAAELDAWRRARTPLQLSTEKLSKPQPLDLAPPARPILPIVQKHSKRRWAIWLVAILALIVATFILRRSLTERQDNVTATARLTPFTSAVGYEVSPSFSPDGASVVYAWINESANQFDLAVKGINSGEEHRLPLHGRRAFGPAWSPDGKYIAFLSNNSMASRAELWITDVNGQSPVKLINTAGDGWPWYNAIAWMPDSKSLVSVGRTNLDDSNGLFLYSLSGNALRRVTDPPAGYSDYFPSVSPDGKMLFFSRLSRGVAALYQTSLVNPAASAAPLFPDKFHNASSAISSWDANGRDVFFAISAGSTCQIWRGRYSGNKISQLAVLNSISQEVVSIDRSKKNGDLILSALQSDSNLWFLSLTGKGDSPRPAEAMLSSTRDEQAAQYSPDGSSIAFESDRSGSWQVWLAKRDGSEAHALTHFGGPVTGSPTWSSDGKSLAFDSRVNGKAEIFVISAAGGEPRQITNSGEPNVVPTFSRDGHWIYFASPGNGIMNIWKIHPDGSARTQITKQGGFKAQESPDGRYIYYTRSHQLITTLRRIASDGGPEMPLFSAVLDRTFAVGRKGVFYGSAANPFSPPEILFANFDSVASPTVIARLPKRISYGLALSPNEHELTFVQIDSKGSDLQLIRGLP